MRFAGLRPLRAAPRRCRTDGRGLRRRLRRFFSELGVEHPHVAGNSMGGAIALELARQQAVSSVTAFSPAGFWTPGERRFAQLSLDILRSVPRPLRPAVRALAATRLGRAVLFKQIFGWPTRIPPDEAVSTLDDAWAAPAFAETLAAFDGYDFTGGAELRGMPVTIAWGKYDRLLIYSRQAPRARERLGWARHVTLGAGHVPFFDDPAAVAETIRLTVKAAEDGPERSLRSVRGRSGRSLRSSHATTRGADGSAARRTRGLQSSRRRRPRRWA